jgi:hypothetical protein
MVVARLQESCYLAVRILEIPERHTSRGTDGDASRIESLFNTMDAECALVSITVGVDEARIVRTGGNTRLAADAHVVFNEHDTAEVMDVTCSGGTAIDTRWIAAMIASL